jgi:hypothetical protein
VSREGVPGFRKALRSSRRESLVLSCCLTVIEMQICSWIVPLMIVPFRLASEGLW